MPTQHYDPKQINPGDEITASAKALKHIQREITKHHGIGIRFGTKKSGCSGNSYIVDVIQEKNTDDFAFELGNNVKVYVSSKDWPLLKGTCFDYIQEGLNHRLIFKNPNETGSCGCGESFSVEP